MGAGQSDLYKGTYGDTSDNIPEALKGKVRLPENDAQLKHIFRKTLPKTASYYKPLQMICSATQAGICMEMTGI